MPTYADKATDELLAEMEKRIARIYKQASDDLQAQSNAYFDSFASRYEKEYAAYLQGKYTDAQFKAWYYAQVGRGERWQVLKTNMAQRMTQANQIAAAYVNDQTPGIYSLNANYTAYEIEGATGIAFDLVNEQAVKNLMGEANHTEFRVLSVNPKRDYKWNTEKIQDALLSGILQGDSIGRLADRYMDVMQNNRNAAIRNARTAVTSAQNGGRQSTFEQARKMGIELQKEWIATNDSRTRDSHRELDGVRVENRDYFPNGCMYPGDPGGEPCEVYNCRCTMRAILPKYNGASRTKNTAKTYEKWLQNKQQKAVNSAIINMSSTVNSTVNLGSSGNSTAFDGLSMDQVHKDAVSDIISNCQYIELREAYEANSSSLKLIDGNYSGGAHYDLFDKGVNLNLTKISKETNSEYPYETFFHEFGHNMDSAKASNGILSAFSYEYRDAMGKSLYDMLTEDYNNLVNYVTNGVKMKKADSAEAVIKKLQSEITSSKAIACTSDILESFTGKEYPLYFKGSDGRNYGCGHGVSYWTKGNGRADRTGCEFFAEVCESMATNPESMTVLETYFPNGVNIVKEMLRAMK